VQAHPRRQARGLRHVQGAGHPAEALRKLCKERELERDIEALRDDLEPDEQSEINMLVDKLGDFANLPLGQAAISRAGNGSGARVTGL
jgi:hypothetical protein